MQAAHELAALANVVDAPVIEHHLDLFFDEFKVNRVIALLQRIKSVLVGGVRLHSVMGWCVLWSGGR
jgi:hypothetical protein